MISPSFSVRMSKGKLALLYSSGMVFILGIVASLILMELTVTVRFLYCGLIVLLLAMMVTTTVSRFDVEGSVIKIRTGFGRAYHVSCEEIEFIACNETHSSRQGTRFSITVATERKHFVVSGLLSGFSEFSGYLLDRLAIGEIKESAVSEKCRMELEKYQKGIYPKKF